MTTVSYERRQAWFDDADTLDDALAIMRREFDDVALDELCTVVAGLAETLRRRAARPEPTS